MGSDLPLCVLPLAANSRNVMLGPSLTWWGRVWSRKKKYSDAGPWPEVQAFWHFMAFYGILAFLPKSLIRNQIQCFRFFPIFRLFPTFRLSDSTTLVVNVWFYTGGGEPLGWWMSGVVNVWGGERLRWWTSGVVNVWFYTGGGERLRWWTSGVVNVWGGEQGCGIGF